jgi:hypothetical protein
MLIVAAAKKKPAVATLILSMMQGQAAVEHGFAHYILDIREEFGGFCN